VRAWGGPDQIEITEVAEPELRPGHLIVGVEAAALNRPDLLVIANEYQVSAAPPFVAGSEFAGRVLSVADDVDSVRVGQRVSGAVPTGAFAEQVCVAADDVTELPDGLDWTAGAAFSVAYRTAYHSLVSFGRLTTGDDVIVLGAGGGVGSAAVDLAVALGARVIAVTSGAHRQAFVESRGAHVVIDRGAGDLRGRLKAAAVHGADLVVDPVGGGLSEPALRSLNWGGRFVVVGFASGEIARMPLNLVLLKGVQVVGFELRTLGTHRRDLVARADLELAELANRGLRPAVGAVCDLADVAAALSDMRDGRVVGQSVGRIR
jgi:NADPH2:quinone reductase